MADFVVFIVKQFHNLNNSIMRRTFILLMVSLFISAGSAQAFAENHDKGKPRQEQRDNRGEKHHHNKKGNPGKDDRHHDKKAHKPSNGPAHHATHVKYGRPGGNAATPPPHLSPMVSKLTRGCQDVNVWQIDRETYLVKYRKGNRHYTRRLYPYANRYDNASLINVNWQPLSLWTLIPPIQLNINL